MSSESLDEYRKVNTIIERDSTDATYKFALLRGAIEVSREYSHLREETADKVRYPLGLLIEKWIQYYYPLIASRTFIPQKNGEDVENSNNKQIQFRSRLNRVIFHNSLYIQYKIKIFRDLNRKLSVIVR